MVKYARWLRRLFHSYKATKIVAFIGVFGLLGVVALMVTRASTFSVGVEAERGRLSGALETISDSAASGESYIKFGRPPTPEGTVMFRLFAPGWRTLGDGANEALRFTEIMGHQSPDAIHRANPAAKLYKYTLGPYVTPPLVPCNLIPPTNAYSPDFQPVSGRKTGCGTRLPSIANWTNAIALGDHDNNANTPPMAVFAEGFDNNFLVHPNSTPWRDFLSTKQIPDEITFENTTTLYDGIFADSVGANPADNPPNYLNAVPINPQTNRLYTKAEWLTASAESLKVRLRALRSSGKVLNLNGLQTGNDYWSSCGAGTPDPLACSSRKLLVDFTEAGMHYKLDGAMSESIFRGAQRKIDSWPDTASWENDVRMIEDVQARGMKGYWWTKCWSVNFSCYNDTHANKLALIKQWRRFTIASYLLGAGDKSYMNYDTSRSDEDSAEYFDDDYNHAIALGTTTMNASDKRVEVAAGSKVYKRTFSNGVVLVNPTTNPYTVTISGNYKKFADGTSPCVSLTNLNLPAHTGEVLVRCTP